MLASLSDLQLKLIGALVAEATDIPDYLTLVPLGLGIAFTATRTLTDLNQAMKLYE